MKIATVRRPGVRWAAGLLAVSCALPLAAAGAESEYDFAKALLNLRTADFNTDDLVERLLVQMAASKEPAMQYEGLLVKAAYRKRQVANADATKRQKLFEEINELYRDFLAKAKGHPLYDEAQREADGMQSLQIRANMEQARELDKSNPAESKRLRDQAVALYDKNIAAFKAQMDEAKRKFDEFFKRFKDEQAKGKEGWQPSAEVVKGLDATFDPFVVSEKRWLNARAEQLNCYAESDPARRGRAEQLARDCQARGDDEVFAEFEFPLVQAFYNYIQGRAFAMVPDRAKAIEAWLRALETEVQNPDDQQRKIMRTLKESIIFDLVNLLERLEQYKQVIQVIENNRPTLKELFEREEGKRLELTYARALVSMKEPSYDRAIRALCQARDREAKGAPTPWSYRFSIEIAKIMDRAAERDLRLVLTPQQWYDVAHGNFLQGLHELGKYQEAEREKQDPAKVKQAWEAVQAEFQTATLYYRKAISLARTETDLAVRLTVEPRAWFEMGLAYSNVRRFLEAAIAFRAVRETFSEDKRKGWLPSPSTPQGRRAMTKAVQDALLEIDRSRDGWLVKCAKNLRIALDLNAQVNSTPFTRDLRVRFLQEQGTADVETGDLDYLAGQADMEKARPLLEDAAAETDAPKRRALYADIAARYAGAAERFLKVKAGVPKVYETALSKAVLCYATVEGLWASGKLASGKDGEDGKAAEFSRKTLALTRQLEDFIAKSLDPSDEGRERRKRIAESNLYSRSFLLLSLAEEAKRAKEKEKDPERRKPLEAAERAAWEEVRQAVAAYTAYLQTDAGGNKSPAGAVMVNQFRAALELSGALMPPACDPYLEEADAAVNVVLQGAADSRLILFLLDTLSYRYQLAADRVRRKEDLKKKGVIVEAGPEAIEVYDAHRADIQLQRLEYLRRTAPGNLTLDDYTSTADLLARTGRQQPALDTALELLRHFDPANKMCRMSRDDAELWKTVRNRMLELIEKMEAPLRYDMDKRQRCKADHVTLVDYMYETARGDPEFDKYPVDLDKAAEQIKTIRRNYPDSPTDNPKLGERGKSFLALVEEEIDFQRRILATRQLVSKTALDLASAAQAEGNEARAKELSATANQQIKLLMAWMGEKPDVQLQSAQLDVLTGKLDDALATLQKLVPQVDQGSLEYFLACKLMSEAYAQKGQWRQAAGYPGWLASVVGFEAPLIAKHWKDIKEFLRVCYKNGAPVPPALKKHFPEFAARNP